MRPREFKTTDIDLAASIITATNTRPVSIESGALVIFIFPAEQAVKSLAAEYASGLLMLEVRRQAHNRAWLYRQIRQMKNTSCEVKK
jgi:hypothetical protein